MELNKKSFTYTDTGYTLKVLGLSFGVFMLLLVILMNYTDIIGLYMFFATIFLIPLGIFFLLKKRIARAGEAEITNAVLYLHLDSKKKTISLKDIRDFKVEYNQGMALKIWTYDGKKHKIVANRNFCDPSPFEAFTDDFQKHISKFNSYHTKPISRKKSGYEKRWMFFLLVLVSILTLGGFAYMLYTHSSLKGAIYIAVGILIAGWYDYFKTKRKLNNPEH